MGNVNIIVVSNCGMDLKTNFYGQNESIQSVELGAFRCSAGLRDTTLVILVMLIITGWHENRLKSV